MKKLAIIGSGIMAEIVINRAKDLEMETHCFSYDKNDVACENATYFHEVDIFEVDKIVNICRDNNIEGVIPTTELTIYPAAQIAEKLGLNGNDSEIARIITNKNITRDKVKKASYIKQPQYWNYIEGKSPQINCYPVIVKPIAAGGKRGICVVHDEQGLYDAIELAIPYSRTKGVLIEEYLEEGQEYSVESLSYKGKHYVIQVTQKDTSGPPKCNELGHHQPAPLSVEMREKVEKAVVELLSITGVENGPCHTEIKIIDEEVYLIEMNPRLGGDHISHPLTELSTGYPYISGVIWVALNQFEGHEPQNLESNYAGIYFVTEETAYLKPIFDKCEEYQWMHTKHKVTDEVSRITFNDPEGLNYFIYFDEMEKPDIDKMLLELGMFV